MVLNRQRHTDKRHRGDAGRDGEGGVAGLDEFGEIPMTLLKTDVANGIPALDASAEVPTALLKTDVANGIAGLDENAELIAATLPASVRQNIALNAFEISMLNTESIHSMLDGVKDVFNDAAGILSGGAVSGGHMSFTNTVVYSEPAEISTQSTTLVLGRSYTVVEDGLHTINYYVKSNSTQYDAFYEVRKNGEVIQSVNTSVTQTTYINSEISTECLIDDVITIYYRQIYNVNYAYLKDVIITTDSTDDVISNSMTAETQPTNIHTVILADDAAIILNTDLNFYVSVDDGATWEQITLSDSGDYSATEKILTGSVAVAGTGTTIKYKIECTNAAFEFYAVGLLWD